MKLAGINVGSVGAIMFVWHLVKVGMGTEEQPGMFTSLFGSGRRIWLINPRNSRRSVQSSRTTLATANEMARVSLDMLLFITALLLVTYCEPRGAYRL